MSSFDLDLDLDVDVDGFVGDKLSRHHIDQITFSPYSSTSRSKSKSRTEGEGVKRPKLLNDGRIPIRIFLQVRHPLGHPRGCRRILQIVIEELEEADRQILAIRQPGN